MDEEYHISETRQLKAVSNPVRMRMLEHLIAESCTATQLGAFLNMAPSRAHYHLKQLEAAGLCRMVEQREHAGILEKYYRAVAARFRLDRTFAAETAGASDAAPEVEAQVDAALRGYLHRLQERDAGAAGADELILEERLFRLSPHRYARLLARLHALLLEFDSEIPSDRPGLRSYRLLLLAYPDEAPRSPQP